MSYPQPPQGPQQQFQQPMPPGQYPQFAPPPPPRKKAKKWPWVVGAIVLLFIVIGVSNGGKTPAPTSTSGAAQQTAPAAAPAPAPAQQPAAAAKRTVVYEVSGAGTANSITYVTDGMTSTQQEGDVQLPWSKTFELPTGEALQMVSIFAQAGKGTPEISAKITVDGKVVKDGKSSGQYAVVNINENIGSLGK
ncbi:hypothetical protein UK23_40735 [Lentzea aerocolonigenes]|uniref:MmpS family membrane protein n=1 Tax=Lentzea aerocolonigenes TaxID=68170 RepID=A0A0F0GGS0_LENAE|nr:MmpS family transport accessory protein [Lentzea aerocolonigenes]KJK39475.1 hypothetical protein UK23_40735 [Lentzea aerocolonigenes]